MKAEINNENKAKFLLTVIDTVKPECSAEWAFYNAQSVQEYPDAFYSEAKPLSQITDEEAIEIGKLAGEDAEEYEGDYGVGSYKDYLLNWSHSLSIFTDVLRYRGYAVDWMGLSVDDLLKAGWIRLDNSHLCGYCGGDGTDAGQEYCKACKGTGRK